MSAFSQMDFLFQALGGSRSSCTNSFETGSQMLGKLNLLVHIFYDKGKLANRHSLLNRLICSHSLHFPKSISVG